MAPTTFRRADRHFRCQRNCIPSFRSFLQFFGIYSGNRSREDVTGFMSHKWWTVVENNLNWIKTIAANIISMTILPAIAGAAIGTLAGLRNKKQDSAKRTEDFCIAMIASGMIIGFVLAGVAGLFFIAYPAEMGRQFLALAVLTLIAVAKFTELGCERLRHLKPDF